MNLKELYNALGKDIDACGDHEVIIELRERDGKVLSSTFLTDRAAETRGGYKQYVIRMGRHHFWER